MLKDIPIRLKVIQQHLDRLGFGYSKIHTLSIKNEAEGIVRACLNELGVYDNNLPIFKNPPTPPKPPKGKIKCRFCNLKFNTERGILAHESVKHRELWKQAR